MELSQTFYYSLNHFQKKICNTLELRHATITDEETLMESLLLLLIRLNLNDILTPKVIRVDFGAHGDRELIFKLIQKDGVDNKNFLEAIKQFDR